MSKLAEPLKIYPQVLENVRVTDKKAAQNDPAVQEAVKAVAEALGDTGRILVRESGTEPLAPRDGGGSRPRHLPEICLSGRGGHQEQGVTPSEAECCGGCCPCTKMRAADALCGMIQHLFVDKPALFAYDKGNTENCVKLAVKRRVRTVCA